MEQQHRPLRVTVDANLLGKAELEEFQRLVAGHDDTEVAVVTVTQREGHYEFEVDHQSVTETAQWGESSWGGAVWGGTVPETWVLGESPLGDAALGSDTSANLFEEILRIISDGSFPPPGKREALSPGQINQLRDAMALEAHTRESRDVFVTRDKKGFISQGRRDSLEGLCSTRICTPDEFAEQFLS